MPARRQVRTSSIINTYITTNSPTIEVRIQKHTKVNITTAIRGILQTEYELGNTRGMVISEVITALNTDGLYPRYSSVYIALKQLAGFGPKYLKKDGSVSKPRNDVKRMNRKRGGAFVWKFNPAGNMRGKPLESTVESHRITEVGFVQEGIYG